MAAPTIVGSVTTADGSTNVPVPGGGASGDFFVVNVYTESGGATIGCSGFTVGATATVGSLTFASMYKAYSGSEGANFAITGTSSYMTGSCALVNGASGAPTFGTMVAVTTSPTDFASLTTPTNDCLLLAFYACFNGQGSPPSAVGATCGAMTNTSSFASDTHSTWKLAITTASATGIVTITPPSGPGDNGGGLLYFESAGGGGGATYVAPKILVPTAGVQRATVW